jgi:hypothetical protein
LIPLSLVLSIFQTLSSITLNPIALLPFILITNYLTS